MRVSRLLTSCAAVALLAGLGLTTAGPASAAGPGITDNGDGTIFVDAVGVNPLGGVSFCSPTVAVADCSGVSASFHNVIYYIKDPTTAFTVGAGFPVFDHGGNPTTLPAGYYTVSLEGDEGYSRFGGLQGVFIGSLAPAPDVNWLQGYARHDASEKCLDGWDPSWALWPNDNTGGWVCVKTTRKYQS